MKIKINPKTQRITISLPDYLFRRLKKHVPARQVSRFISQAVSEKLPIFNLVEDPIEAFLRLGKDFPKISMEQLLKNIRRGRA